MDDSSLHRFFKNESTTSERELVIKWLLQPENNLLVVNWMKSNWDLVEHSDGLDAEIDPDVNKIWLKIHHTINETPFTFSESHSDIIKNKPHWRFKKQHFLWYLSTEKL